MNESKKQIIVNISEEQTIIDLSQKLRSFNAEIYLKKVVQGDIYEINLKSFLGLITMRIKNGDQVWVRAVGEESETALETVVDYLT